MASEQVAQARPNHDGNAISEAHSGHSLFDASETRFLTDSLSSADTFDPFTIGAPGFKVPSVLPPNLGGMGAPPRSANPNGGSYEASMSTSATAGPSNYYTMPSVSAQASSSQPRASMGLAGQNWEKSAHRPSLFDPQWLNATAAANGDNSSAERSSFSSADQSMGMASGGEGSKAGEGSGSGSNTPVGSGQRGAYGKDRAWQLAQLEALQAERDKYLAHTRSGSGRLESIPSTLRATFHSTPFEKLQPHLEMLREQRRAGLLKKCDSKRLGGSAEVDADEEGGSSKASSSAAASAAKKEKGAPHVLLTDAEKKANHIASEQKRRANIRKGYEMLCDLVPNLREALGAEASAAEKSRDGSSMDTDPSPAPAAASKKKEGWEVGGEKIDGRAGPRSEAIVLHETVEYVRQRLEEHQALVIRQQAARKAVAARYGADISIAMPQARSEHTAAPKSKSKKAKS
ncbi:hypothetical protein CBOM_05884 [Ceraceosorus bombacis]|uniref:BHLH domain-containing protein n=1 Tax=Ceraceosorus bombacis TaxID=401625 RepID=A0A0P1BJ10_9BASI|nr:hypothetical protein CBOM_05884 [Ceraceosorus bombacis]